MPESGAVGKSASSSPPLSNVILGIRLLKDRRPPSVITGRVPVITMKKNAALHRSGMAGTSPAMTWRSEI
jgi:hypothetical protein